MRALVAGVWNALALAAAAQPSTAYDPEKALLGGGTYRTHCAVCHGAAAHGDGPLADQLRFAAPDLTRIAIRNAGKFPADRVARIIDGRKPLKGHGGTDMPVWGDAFKSVGEGYDDKAVKQRIDELVQYLASLQPRK